MSGPRKVVVIGGGVVGLCAAYYARKKGHDVTVVERGGPDRDFCSLGNAGLLTPSHIVPLAAPGTLRLGMRMMFRPDSPFYFRPGLDRDVWEWAWKFRRSATASHVERAAPVLLRLNLESRDLYAALDREIGGFGFTRKGCLMLCRTERALHEEAEAAAMARHLGMAAEMLMPGEVARLEPGLRLDAAGGAYYPEDGHMIPHRFAAALARALEESGVRFVWNAEVTGWASEKGRVTAVRTRDGEAPGDAFVLAAGSWSSRLARMLGLRMPVVAGRGYSLTLPHPPKRLSVPAILIEARVAVTPMGETLRFAGTMEITAGERPVSEKRVEAIRRSVPLYFPDFGPQDFKGVPGWSGLRPLSPDGLPYVGPFRRFPNLIAATGHAMMGVSLAPVTGSLVAELLSGESPSLPLDLLVPDRFDRRRPGG